MEEASVTLSKAQKYDRTDKMNIKLGIETNYANYQC